LLCHKSSGRQIFHCQKTFLLVSVEKFFFASSITRFVAENGSKNFGRLELATKRKVVAEGEIVAGNRREFGNSCLYMTSCLPSLHAFRLAVEMDADARQGTIR